MMNEPEPKVANGLTLLKITSSCNWSGTVVEEQLGELLAETFSASALGVIWFDENVEFCLYRHRRFLFFSRERLVLRHVQRMRVFNKESELHIWRTDDSWHGESLRTDGSDSGEQHEVVVAHQLMHGAWVTEQKGMFTTVTDELGNVFHLPLLGLQTNESGRLPKEYT